MAHKARTNPEVALLETVYIYAVQSMPQASMYEIWAEYNLCVHMHVSIYACMYVCMHVPVPTGNQIYVSSWLYDMCDCINIIFVQYY